MKKALVFIILLILAAIVMIFAVNCDNDNNEIATGDFNINGIRITAPAIFWQNTEHGETLMLPLQAIVEELGYNFSFDARSGVIQVGDAIDLSIGDDMIYFHGWLVSIGAAPMVVDNTVAGLGFAELAADIEVAMVLEVVGIAVLAVAVEVARVVVVVVVVGIAVPAAAVVGIPLLLVQHHHL